MELKGACPLRRSCCLDRREAGTNAAPPPPDAPTAVTCTQDVLGAGGLSTWPGPTQTWPSRGRKRDSEPSLAGLQYSIENKLAYDMKGMPYFKMQAWEGHGPSAWRV